MQVLHCPEACQIPSSVFGACRVRTVQNLLEQAGNRVSPPGCTPGRLGHFEFELAFRFKLSNTKKLPKQANR